ncbi:MAG: ATP-binding protein [Bacteroidota bacterium]
MRITDSVFLLLVCCLLLLPQLPLAAKPHHSIPLLRDAYEASHDQEEKNALLLQLGDRYAQHQENQLALQQYELALANVRQQADPQMEQLLLAKIGSLYLKNDFNASSTPLFRSGILLLLILIGLLTLAFFREQKRRRHLFTMASQSQRQLREVEAAYQFQLSHNRQLRSEGEATRQAFEQLEKSNEELRGFAYMAAHDLKEPLRTIGSYAGLIRRRYRQQLDEDGQQFLGFITDGIGRMHNMLSEVLNYSGLMATKEQIAVEWVDTQALVKELQQNLHQQITDKGATIIVEDLPPVMADPNHLRQIFQNLVSNALKYNDNEKPTVLIDCRRKDGQYVFGVHDNGIGLDMSFKEKIFEAFQRLHGKQRYEGTGIGLAICKKLIEQYEGNIWVESEIGQGSRFFFSLPALAVEAVPATA